MGDARIIRDSLLFLLSLCILGVRAGTAECGTARITWKKTFPNQMWIQRVGVDEDRFKETGTSSDLWLKWLYGESRGLFLFDRRGEVLPRPVKGLVGRSATSPSGEFFVESRFARGRIRSHRLWFKLLHWRGTFSHTLRRWDGRALWQTTARCDAAAHVWDDASAVLVLASWDDPEVYLMKFLDRYGRPRGTYRVPEGTYLKAERIGANSDYIAMILHRRRSGDKVLLFDRMGKLVRTVDIESGPETDSLEKRTFSSVRGITMSDRGDIIVVRETRPHNQWDLLGATVLIYDRWGRMADEFQILSTGYWSILDVVGPYLIMSTYVFLNGTCRADLLLYNVEKTRLEFRVPSADGGPILSTDLDLERGLIATSVRGRERHPVTVVYDLTGEYVTEIETLDSATFVKFMGGALLVVEGNTLGLYEIDVE